MIDFERWGIYFLVVITTWIFLFIQLHLLFRWFDNKVSEQPHLPEIRVNDVQKMAILLSVEFHYLIRLWYFMLFLVGWR